MYILNEISSFDNKQIFTKSLNQYFDMIIISLLPVIVQIY